VVRVDGRRSGDDARGLLTNRRIADAALITIIGAIAVAQSWMRWLDPIVDTGRDLYIPEQLANGAKLYRDIVYFYPPVAPYLLAGITKIIGHSIAAYVVIGLAIAAATTALVYFITLRVANRLAAVSAASLFVACSMAGQSTWGCNYIFPYAHAATLAMLFFLGMIAALIANRPSIALACAVAASWTKVEYVAFTVIVLVVATIAYRLRVWIAGAYIAAMALAFVIVSALFADTDWLFGNVLPDVMVHSEALRIFYRGVAGFDQWPLHLGQSLLGAVALGVAVILLRRHAVTLAVVIIALVAASSLFFRSWAVIEIALIPIAIKRRDPKLALLLAAALCASSRVFLNLTPVWYGFVLTVPLYLLIAYVLFEWLPSIDVYSRSASRAWLAAIVVSSLVSLGAAHVAYGKKTHAIVTPRATIYDANPDRAAILNVAFRGVDNLVVIPEGLALNYLFELPTPIRYYTFTPAEAADARAEERIMREIETKKPEWIAIMPRDMREFGSQGFGKDYDLKLAAMIRDRYAIAATSVRPDFTMVMLKRK
jgi:hypothetical protein